MYNIVIEMNTSKSVDELNIVNNVIIEIKEKPKRVKRAPAKKKTTELVEIIQEQEQQEQKQQPPPPVEEHENNVVNQSSSVKKRGRKPKGGKIVNHVSSQQIHQSTKPNVILHLKCSLNDLTDTCEHDSNFTPSDINPYNLTSGSGLKYELLESSSTPSGELLYNPSIQLNSTYITHIINPVSYTNTKPLFSNIFQHPHGSSPTNIGMDINTNNFQLNQSTSVSSTTHTHTHLQQQQQQQQQQQTDTRDISRKLRILEQNLHTNSISGKKSACFWCTCDFDNPSIHIPKHCIKESYHVYGCFCSPECATAYLMEENIDSSVKFERYHLLNHVYSKIYEYKKNIKPAPNPYYMLDKYYGNLSIQEYRSLLKSGRLFLMVDKPMTRILPEFHEDNDEFVINNKIISSSSSFGITNCGSSNNGGSYHSLNNKMGGRNNNTVQSKNNIVNEKFGGSGISAKTINCV